MTDLDDLVDIRTAADILGVRPLTVRDAIRRGRIYPARLLGSSHRGTWITTRDALARYQAHRDATRRAG